ncbi:hypothetical protein KAW43_02785 [Candidatus Parcubacteria bacterium]|nr:hypothetical protein [Candidatus Parcubacteria bacterium]
MNIFEKLHYKLQYIDKRILIILAIAAVVLLIAIICIVFLGNKEKPLTPQEKQEQEQEQEQGETEEDVYHYTPLTKTDCENTTNKQEKQKCFDRLEHINILMRNNYIKCLDITTLEVRDDCLLNFAYSILLNDNLCFAISDPQKRHLCVDRIIITNRDKNACKKHFGDEPFECQECMDRISAFNIGEDKNPEKIYECQKIKSLEYPRLCLWMSFKNTFKDNCELVPLEFRPYCIAYYTIHSASTKEHCSAIALEQYKDFCLAKVEAGGWRGVASLDSDNDGITDWNDLFMGLDPKNPDTDGDGLSDGDEMSEYHTNPTEKDTDNDGLTDYQEIKIYHTNPQKPDTDGDGILDGKEIRSGSNALSGDRDKDGLLDEIEKKIGTNINKKDTDGDGMTDGDEWKRGLNPLKPGAVLSDTDKDGLKDLDEIFYGTDRLNPDTDGDGILDGEEIKRLTNPLGKGYMDFDNDGITDKQEIERGTNPVLPDAGDSHSNIAPTNASAAIPDSEYSSDWLASILNPFLSLTASQDPDTDTGCQLFKKPKRKDGCINTLKGSAVYSPDFSGKKVESLMLIPAKY